MPIYGYACKSCEHSFDALQKMSDPKLIDCPECGEPSLRKLLSAPKFRFKGVGWYETDFKTGDKRNLAGDTDEKSTGDADKSADTDEPAKKADTKTPDTKTPETKTAETKTAETKTVATKKPSADSKAKSV